MIVSVIAGEQVVHARLCLGRIPGLDCSLCILNLTGLDDQLAAVDVRLEDVHRAIIERNGVGVVLRAGEDLHGVGLRGVGKIQLIGNVLSLQLAHTNQVKRDVIVKRRSIGDQAVAGDDVDAGFLCLFTRVSQSRAVNGCDNQCISALGNHVLDLHNLLGRVVFSVLDQGVVALCAKRSNQALTLAGPGGLLFCRHQDTDGLCVIGGIRGGRLFALGSARTEHGSQQGENQ